MCCITMHAQLELAEPVVLRHHAPLMQQGSMRHTNLRRTTEIKSVNTALLF